MNAGEFQRLVSRVSRSFGISLRLLPREVRSSLSLAYALARVSDTMADSAENDAEERIRLLKELPTSVPRLKLHDGAEQDLLVALPDLLGMLERSPDRDLILDVWAKIRQGQIFDLERFPSSTALSPAERGRYVYLVAGCVGEFWTELCVRRLSGFSGRSIAEMRDLGCEFGEGLQRVNILRDRKSDANLGRIYVSEQDVVGELNAARAGMRCGHQYAADVCSFRARIAVALPARLGDQTLDLVEKHPASVRVKVSRSRVWRTLVEACLFSRRLATICVAVILVGGASFAPAATFAPESARWTLREPALIETSGLAASQRDSNFLWALNDGGGSQKLYLLDHTGGAHGSVTVTGTKNSDWEDLDSFVLDGKPYLLIADTGDNRSARRACQIIVVPEPDVASGTVSGSVSPSWTVRFRYEDGPRDCESVAVSGNKVLLISKRTWPPVLYELPLRPNAPDAIAQRQGNVNLPKADVWEGPYASQPVGLALSPDGKEAALLTYARVFLYTRQPDESWADAFAREPERLRRHGLEQAEAIAFSRDGNSIFVLSEGRSAPIVSYLRTRGEHASGR